MEESTVSEAGKRRKSVYTTEALMREVAEGKGRRISDLCNLVPRRAGGKPVRAETVWRWAVDGVQVTPEQRIRLEALWMGRRLVSSEQALARFLERQNPITASPPTDFTPSPSTPAPSRQQQHRQADGL